MALAIHIKFVSLILHALVFTAFSDLVCWTDFRHKVSFPFVSYSYVWGAAVGPFLTQRQGVEYLPTAGTIRTNFNMHFASFMIFMTLCELRAKSMELPHDYEK
jgi:hypothetical protein